ncbi:cyclic nucleotide-binding domain-containing protein [Agarilytica rhodophyticola]|uniref:cyclic nucleotide-binding domain-containing protein n=1 Tax=Agarilytica rhodophyticola TaxID=1737490 RepID=UPI000B348DE1|nr:cyclic nucleotide-binding domain-containing protein [Agarilytica rhodophyticola]
MMAFDALFQSRGQLVANAFQTADTLVPLKSLRPTFIEDLFQHVTVHTVFANETLFEDGAIDGQHIYLQSGDAELQYPNGFVEVVRASETFLPLAHQQPRPCRCVTLSDCTVMRIDSDRVDRTLAWSQISEYMLSELSLERDYDEDIEWMQTVLNSNLFLKAPPVNAEHIFSRLTPMVVEDGDVIITQGEVGDCCYFIKEGNAKVIVRYEDADNTELLAEIGPGRCFGEDALVNDAPRNASVIMTSDGVLMRLEKSDFAVLLRDPAIDEISREDVKEMMEEPIYVDVRTEEEYAAGHLAFSANLPLSLLSIKKRLLAPEKLHILYCDTSKRSYAAAYLLGKLGYNVMALEGGINGAEINDELVTNENHILRDGVLVSGQ